jgi:hypothetical protein
LSYHLAVRALSSAGGWWAIRLVGSFGPVLVAAGCSGPVITDISSESLTVLKRGYHDDEVRVEAARGCGLYGKRAIPISERSGGYYQGGKLVLFACVDPDFVPPEPPISRPLQ